MMTLIRPVMMRALCSTNIRDAVCVRFASSEKPDIVLTPACVEQLKAITADDEYLRVTVDSGGCSGFEYKFKLDKQVNADDHRICVDGARVLVDTLSLEYVRGATIDYQHELIRSAFRIKSNPLAEKGCSCGSSFAVKMD